MTQTKPDPDILIHPRRGRKERLLPGRALLVVNPSESAYALSCFEGYGVERRPLYHSNLAVDRHGRVCLAGPALGAPAAGLVLEKLIALGVSDVLLISCCGAIDPGFAIGDIVIGLAGISGEGVSRSYLPDCPVYPCLEAYRALSSDLKQLAIPFKEGFIWSTDAPYRERNSVLFGLQEQYGVVGVDMEFSALCSIAAFRKISLSALFVVSDVLWGPEWTPGFTTTAFRSQMHSMIEALIAHSLDKEPRD